MIKTAREAELRNRAFGIDTARHKRLPVGRAPNGASNGIAKDRLMPAVLKPRFQGVRPRSLRHLTNHARMPPLCKTGDECPPFAVFVQFGGRRWRREARVSDTENLAATGGRQ